jgi:uncharacterized protein
MKITYLHGLESNNIGPKNDWLKSISDLFDPYIDYRESNIYQSLKSKIIAFQPDIIIGSSMGGYFAYNLAKELDIKAILFNPALHSRSFQPDITKIENGKFNPFMHLVLGKNDAVIDPIKTLDFIKNEGYKNFDYTILNHSHNTSFELFKSEIENFIKSKC